MPHLLIRKSGIAARLGGSIVNADPAAELPVMMLALNARLKARNAAGERWIDAHGFFYRACSPPLLQPMKFWLRSNCQLCSSHTAGRLWKLRRAQAIMP